MWLAETVYAVQLLIAFCVILAAIGLGGFLSLGVLWKGMVKWVSKRKK